MIVKKEVILLIYSHLSTIFNVKCSLCFGNKRNYLVRTIEKIAWKVPNHVLSSRSLSLYVHVFLCICLYLCFILRNTYGETISVLLLRKKNYKSEKRKEYQNVIRVVVTNQQYIHTLARIHNAHGIGCECSLVVFVLIRFTYSFTSSCSNGYRLIF